MAGNGRRRSNIKKRQEGSYACGGGACPSWSERDPQSRGHVDQSRVVQNRTRKQWRVQKGGNGGGGGDLGSQPATEGGTERKTLLLRANHGGAGENFKTTTQRGGRGVYKSPSNSIGEK